MIIKTTVLNLPGAKEVVNWNKAQQNINYTYLAHFMTNPDIKDFKIINENVNPSTSRSASSYQCSFLRKEVYYEIEIKSLQDLSILLINHPNYCILWGGKEFILTYLD